MRIAVDPDEPVSSLFIVREGVLRVSPRAKHRGQVQLCRVEEEIVPGAGFPASVISLIGQFLGAGQITHGAAVVDQVGGGRERRHVLVTQVFAITLTDMLPLTQRVPVMTGLAQRGRESLTCPEPVRVLSPANRFELIPDPTRYVQRVLIFAETAQVTSYRII